VRLVVFGVVLALLLADAVVLRDILAGPSGTEALHAAQKYVEHHGKVRFEGTEVVDVRDDEDKSKSVQKINGKLSGAFEGLDRSHLLVDEGDRGAVEIIALERTIYTRIADTAAGLRNEQYATLEVSTRAGNDESYARLRALNIASLVTNADNARRLHYANNKTTIRVDVDPVKLLGPRLARNVTGISLKLVVRRNGQILSMEQTSGGGGAIVTTTLHYSNWNEPQQIAAPPREQIDPTPSVDEEAIAAFKDAPLYMPRGIPDGWAFSAARVFDADETTEGCREAMLGYENPNDPNAGYLEIYQFPLSCERPMTGSGVVAFSPGGHAGTAQTGDEGSFAQIHVGKTVVQAETDLSLEDLGAVLETLVPLNLKQPPTELPGVGRKRVTA
jgi:hypothetical protein